MRRVMFRYPLQPGVTTISCQQPAGTGRSVGWTDKGPQVWLEVDPDTSPTGDLRRFWTFATGESIPLNVDLEFVGTMIQPATDSLGDLVWHVFEQAREHVV